MQFFRHKLMNYDTDRELSTLLHIHVETDRPRVLIPQAKSKNYVDELINDYTIKMYDYPELSSNEKEFALNVYNRKRSSVGIFQVDEIRRRNHHKKKGHRKNQIIDHNKPCSCCAQKSDPHHSEKCEHTFCLKPCSKISKQKNQNFSQSQIQQKEDKQSMMKDMEEEEEQQSIERKEDGSNISNQNKKEIKEIISENDGQNGGSMKNYGSEGAQNLHKIVSEPSKPLSNVSLGFYHPKSSNIAIFPSFTSNQNKKEDQLFQSINQNQSIQANKLPQQMIKDDKIVEVNIQDLQVNPQINPEVKDQENPSPKKKGKRKGKLQGQKKIKKEKENEKENEKEKEKEKEKREKKEKKENQNSQHSIFSREDFNESQFNEEQFGGEVESERSSQQFLSGIDKKKKVDRKKKKIQKNTKNTKKRTRSTKKKQTQQTKPRGKPKRKINKKVQSVAQPVIKQEFEKQKQKDQIIVPVIKEEEKLPKIQSEGGEIRNVPVEIKQIKQEDNIKKQQEQKNIIKMGLDEDIIKMKMRQNPIDPLINAECLKKEEQQVIKEPVQIKNEGQKKGKGNRGRKKGNGGSRRKQISKEGGTKKKILKKNQDNDESFSFSASSRLSISAPSLKKIKKKRGSGGVRPDHQNSVSIQKVSQRRAFCPKTTLKKQFASYCNPQDLHDKQVFYITFEDEIAEVLQQNDDEFSNSVKQQMKKEQIKFDKQDDKKLIIEKKPLVIIEKKPLEEQDQHAMIEQQQEKPVQNEGMDEQQNSKAQQNMQYIKEVENSNSAMISQSEYQSEQQQSEQQQQSSSSEQSQEIRKISEINQIPLRQRSSMNDFNMLNEEDENLAQEMLSGSDRGGNNEGMLMLNQFQSLQNEADSNIFEESSLLE